MAIVSAAEFAEFIGKSAAWISKQITAGMPVAAYGENGLAHEIDSVAACAWLLDVGNAQARLKHAQAQKAEFENEVRRGELIPIELHGELLRKVAGEVVGQMSGFPGRVAGKIASIKDPALVRAKLIDECNEVRNAVANLFGEIADTLGEMVETATAPTEVSD